MKLKYNILALLSATLFTACTTDLTLDLKGTTPELVVEGTMTTDAIAHSVSLKKTSNYFANAAADMVSGAVVTLSDGQNTITLTEDAVKKGIYLTPADYAGVVGRTYTLTIDNVDVNADGVKERYTASCPISSLIQLDSIDVVKSRIFQTDMWAVKAWVQDPATEVNYYLIRNYKNDVCTSDSIQEWQITNDEFFNGKYMINETFSYFSSKKPDEKLVVGDRVTLELCSVTKDYMEYIQQAQDEFWGRNPLFGGQPANIRTNIKQVVPANSKTSPHGYFAAYSVSWKKAVYQGK
jgi:hypothetical protein